MTNLSLDVISRKQICKQLGVSRDTIRNWISKRNFPKTTKHLWKRSFIQH